MARKPRDWFVCPVCGEEVDADALACPECGADDRTGWSSETAHDGLDLPDPDEKQAEDAVWRDPDGAASSRRPGWVLVTAILVVAAFVAMALWGVF